MKEEFKERLIERAKSRAFFLGYHLTPETELTLRAMIEMGLDRLSPEEINSPVSVFRALNNTETLVERLIQDSRSKSSSNLDYKSFNSIRDVICPLWPFC